MIRNDTSIKQQLVSVFIIGCMVGSGVFTLFAFQVGGSEESQPVPEFILPSVINNEIIEMRDEGVYDADFPITISNGGTLKIINTTLNFLQDGLTDYFIDVNTFGNLILENSTITTAATPLAMWDPLFEMTFDNANFSMTDHSVLAFPGWLNITDTTTYLEDSWITSVFPESLATHEEWAREFPSYTDVIGEGIGEWWYGTDVDLEDFNDDGPIIKFIDCENVTIADSRIDELYEDEDLIPPAPFNISFLPSIASTSPGPAGDVNNLTAQDLQYMVVLPPISAQILSIDEFDTLGYLDANYDVNSVWVHALYNTTWDGGAGYAGTDEVEWRIEAGVYADCFPLVSGAPPWAESYSLPLSPTPTISQLADLDIQFDNTYASGDGIVFFDLIELVVNIQPQYDTYPTMITVDNTELSIINSYVNADWISFNDRFAEHNAFDLINDSNLYLYNVSIEDDHVGSILTIPDFLEIPGDEDPLLYTPFRVESGSEVYYFKWVEVPVVDKYGAPVEGAYINSTFDFSEVPVINKISNINNLDYNDTADWNYSKMRVMDYLGVTGDNYNITGSNGRAIIPLLTTFFNSTNYPNGEHIGEYDIAINYTKSLNDNYTAFYDGCDFYPFPNIMPDDNLIVTPTVQLSSLTLPRPFGTPGLIVNATTGNLNIGLAGVELAIPDFIIVEDSAILTISNVDLLMSYSNTVPFEIIVRDSGELVLNNVDMTTLNSMPITVHLENNAKLTMTDTDSDQAFDYMAYDDSVITLTRSTISGDFDVIDRYPDDPLIDPAVTLNAQDTEFGRNLDAFSGDSVATLVGCYSPASSFTIAPSDNAVVWIYRNIDVAVYDGLIPANPLENVNVWVNNIWDSTYNSNGQTDATGHFMTSGLTDKIYYDSNTGGVIKFPCGLYSLVTQYMPGSINHNETTSPDMASYPSMLYGDATSYVTVVLENVLPDLDPPVNIWPLVNNSVGRGDVVNIGTIINNIGDATAENIDVWFNDTFMGETEIIYFETIETLAPGETFNISFEYEWSSVDYLGEHEISVVVDPMNDIPEQNPGGETNNNETRLINVTSQPDLAILYYYDVSFSSSYPLVNSSFDIMANIYNLGDVNATDVVVSFYDDVNGWLGNVTIPNILPDTTTPMVVTLADISYDTSGSYYIYVAIDEANTISEVDEGNNNNSVSPLTERYLRIWENSDLNLGELDIINELGEVVTECDFRTEVTLRARVWNIGELHASNVRVEFWADGLSIGGSSTVSSITTGSDEYFTITWEATADVLSEVHTITAQAIGTGLTSNIASQDITVNDNRPDLEIVSVDLADGALQITDGETFLVNVTLANNGETATAIRLEVFSSESDYLNTTIIRLEQNDSDIHVGRLGNVTINLMSAGTVNHTITCTALTEGEHDLFIVVDLDYNKTDSLTILGTPYDIVGDIEEYDELNNNATLVDVTVIMPELLAMIDLPAHPGNGWGIGETDSIMVSGRIVRQDNTNIGISGISVTITSSDGQTFTTQSGMGGSFIVNLVAPEIEGNYTVTVTGTNVGSDSAWFEITESDFPILFIIIGIILAVVAVIGGITAYLYFVGLGKTVQCGECGAFIPEGAKKCPKCGVEFEDEVAKCSVCGSWVPIDVKNCPDCGTEFTVGTEDLDDYEANMKRQYDDIVRKFKQEAKGELGAEFTETEFQAWWATQATFVTFDQWLQEEEEMKRMGSKPCHSCGTENSVTAKICHKCGTVMEEEEAPEPPKKPEGKMPGEKKAAEEPKAEPAPAAVPAPVSGEPTEKPAEAGGDKKSCPSCGMEVAGHENVCPICNFEFQKKPAEGKPPESPPAGGAPVKRVVKKPVKRVVKRPVQKDGQ